MNNQEKDQQFLHAVKQELEQSARDIDGQTLSRLTQIRYKALAKAKSRDVRSYLIPLSAFATACLVVSIIFLFPRQTDEQTNMVEDIELISSSESLEFYEDLEFYEWLEDYELPT